MAKLIIKIPFLASNFENVLIFPIFFGAMRNCVKCDFCNKKFFWKKFFCPPPKFFLDPLLATGAGGGVGVPGNDRHRHQCRCRFWCRHLWQVSVSVPMAGVVVGVGGNFWCRCRAVGARKKFGVGVWKSEKTSIFGLKNVQKVHKIIFLRDAQKICAKVVENSEKKFWCRLSVSVLIAGVGVGTRISGVGVGTRKKFGVGVGTHGWCRCRGRCRPQRQGRI